MNRRRAIATFATAGVTLTSGCSQLESITRQFTDPSVEEIKDEAENVQYEELYRNISEYEDKYLYWPQANITDIPSAQGTKKYILSLPNADFNDFNGLWGIWEGDPFRENDDVEVWGMVLGMKTYNSFLGQTTVPKIQIKAMNLR